jgi:elongation factor Tu
MDAMDEYIPDPEREVDKPFLMPVEDVFSIKGRGTVGTGRIERGKVRSATKSRSSVCATPARPSSPASRCSTRRWTRARRATTSAAAARRGEEGPGARPGDAPSPARSRRTPSSSPEVYVLTKEEGGRHTPFFPGYRPQFYFRTTDVTGDRADPDAGRQARRDVHARRQHHDGSRDHLARSRWKRSAVRHPRRRPHRRRRRRHQD